MTEAEARLIVEGIRYGYLDELDLLGIVEDYAVWLTTSESYVAHQIRNTL